MFRPSSYRYLTIRAGRKALAQIKDEGLNPDRIRVMAGAAGGPKWLVFPHLDRFLFGNWFKDRVHPLFLLGASIGAWRFAAACFPDPVAAFDRFEEAYIEQRYSEEPSPEQIKAETRWVQSQLFGRTRDQKLLDHPFMKLNILAVRARGLTGSENMTLQGAGFLLAAGLNAVRRSWLKVFFDRVLFFNPEPRPPFFAMDGFPIIRAPLSGANLKQALLASGAIPMVLPGVTDIPDAPEGVYRDAGALDYHLDLPFLGKEDGLVFFPHFSDRIIPGWLDKRLTWRKPDPQFMNPVVLVAPSKEWVARLPLGKIPDRTDFITFKGRNEDRIAYWRKVSEESRLVAETFKEAVGSGHIRNLVEPL